jgi:ABC-type branched-subunit amino acid transport system permease subunit
MDTFLRSASFIFLYGVSYGVVLFTISVGLMLTLGLMRVINLAHGAFAAVGGYLAVSLMNSYGVGFLSAAIAASVAVAIGSVVVERLLYVKLYGANELDQVLMTVGLVFLTTAALNLFFGPDLLPARLPSWLMANLDLGLRTFQTYRIVIVAIGAVLIAALWFLFERTPFGARLRAAVDNRGMASVMGIDVGRLYSVAFAVGSGLAALGGAVGFPMLPLEPLYPLKYITMVLIVVSLAGFGNIKSAAPAAISVGVVDTAARFLFPVVGAFAVYIMFIAVMAWRASDDAHRSHLVSLPGLVRKFQPLEILFWAFLPAVYVFFPGYLSLATTILIMALFSMSLDLVLGFAGIMTLGHGIYFGIGAYSAAWIALAGWQEPVSCLVLSGVAAAIAGAVLGPFVLQRRGLSLIMVTFVLALIFYEAANKATDITGGDNGLSGFKFDPLFGLLNWSVYSRVEYLYALTCLFGLFYASKCMVTSPFGLALRGIRENPDRMAFVGAPVLGHLIRIYVFSAFMAGVAGALAAQTTRFVGLGVAHLDISVNALVMLVLGGVGVLYGAIVGAGVYMFVHHLASEWNPYHWMFIIGILLVAVVRLGGGGLLGLGDAGLRYLMQMTGRVKP